MKYKGLEIEKPTYEQIVEYVKKEKFSFSPADCYAYFKEKQWKTNKGYEFSSLEVACNVYNSIYVFSKRHKKIKNEEFDTSSYERSPYREQLLDKRWRAYRDFVFIAKGKECEHCSSKKNLQIHHLKYIDGYNAWDYSAKDVVVLCSRCHKKIHNISLT